MNTSGSQCKTDSGAEWVEVSVSRWEGQGVYAILAVYLAVQINSIYNLAFIGQDFAFHASCTQKITLNPSKWFYMDSTSRPLLYWIGSACERFTHAKYTYELASIIFVLLSAVSLFLVHRSSLLLIKTALFRISALIFVTFLPLTIISSVVYAADTVALLPFALLAFFLSQIASGKNPTKDVLYAAGASVALCIGLFSKATFSVLPIGVVLLCIVFWRTHLQSLGKATKICAIIIIAPLLLGVAVQARVARELAGEPPRHVFDWRGTGEMTVRSLVVPRLSDIRILDAPSYWEVQVKENGERVLPLLVNNSYSYPALLVLGVFTDVMDYANQGGLDNGTLRPDKHQLFATIAVRAGMIASVLIVLSLVSGIFNLFDALCKSAKENRVLLVWVVLVLSWALPLVALLPFVLHAYQWGYWLPRLIVPAVWGSGLLLFAKMENWLTGRSFTLSVLFLLFILIQAVVHIASVWY